MDYEPLIDALEECLVKALRHPAPQNSLELSQGEQGLLRCLAAAPEGITPGGLRTALCVGSGRVASILNALEHKGLANRRMAEDDSRKVIVTITPAGATYIAEKHARFRQEQLALLKALGPEDAREFVRLMTRIATLQDEPKA